MASFKKNIVTKGTFKGVCVHDGILMDEETGEAIDFAVLCAKAYGEDVTFDIAVSQKTDEDLDI